MASLSEKQISANRYHIAALYALVGIAMSASGWLDGLLYILAALCFLIALYINYRK